MLVSRSSSTRVSTRSMVSEKLTLSRPSKICTRFLLPCPRKRNQSRNPNAALLKANPNNCTHPLTQQTQPILRPPPAKTAPINPLHLPDPTQIIPNLKMYPFSHTTVNSSLSQYGNNLVNNMTSMQLLDQNRIYEKQEK